MSLKKGRFSALKLSDLLLTDPTLELQGHFCICSCWRVKMAKQKLSLREKIIEQVRQEKLFFHAWYKIQGCKEAKGKNKFLAKDSSKFDIEIKPPRIIGNRPNPSPSQLFYIRSRNAWMRNCSCLSDGKTVAWQELCHSVAKKCSYIWAPFMDSIKRYGKCVRHHHHSCDRSDSGLILNTIGSETVSVVCTNVRTRLTLSQLWNLKIPTTFLNDIKFADLLTLRL